MKKTLVRIVAAVALIVCGSVSLAGQVYAAPMHDPNGVGHTVSSPMHDPN